MDLDDNVVEVDRNEDLVVPRRQPKVFPEPVSDPVAGFRCSGSLVQGVLFRHGTFQLLLLTVDVEHHHMTIPG